MSHEPRYGFSAAGGPGQSGAAPGAEAAARMESASDVPTEMAGGDGEEPLTTSLAGKAPGPGAVSGPTQVYGAGVGPGAVRGSELGPESDHEARLERDLEELTAKAEKADEYLELAQRTRADFENFRKRAARETAAAQERGMVKLARELLPAVDNLDRALAAARLAVPAPDGQAADDGAATLVSGIKLVHADVIAALARVGIEPFSPQGEPFDPQFHEAIAQQPIEGAEPGTVVEVYQRGFRLGDSVLRPARVVVAG
jgi:molecular chaperone GrpE